MSNITLTYSEMVKDINTYLSHHKNFGEAELYQMFQPTGLLYGRSLQNPVYLSHHPKNISLKTSIQSAYILISTIKGYGEEKMKSCFEEYFKLFHNLRHNNSSTKKIDNLFEQYVLKHTLDKTDEEIRISLNQVFFDVLFYKSWIESDKKLRFEDYDQALSNKLKTSLALYKVDGLDQTEVDCFKQQIKLYNLTDETKIALLDLLKSNAEIYDLTAYDSDLSKRYLLEQVIMSAWTDGHVSDLEFDFFNQLAVELGFSESICSESQLAVECFILNNLDKLPEVKSPRKEVTATLQKRVAKFFDRNKKAIIQEINESKELVSLLKKSATEPLTPEEKKKVKEQILDILKMIPSFAIFIMPFGSLILPLILKIIPDHILKPSAYLEEDKA